MKLSKLILSSLVLLMPLISLHAEKMVFTVEGPEETYNRVSVVNETSQANFVCRIVILNDDDTTRELYGIYNLTEINDHDSNTNWLKRGTRLGVVMPKDFPVEVTCVVEYKDRPLYDYIIVHLFDKNKEFDE